MGVTIAPVQPYFVEVTSKIFARRNMVDIEHSEIFIEGMRNGIFHKIFCMIIKCLMHSLFVHKIVKVFIGG